MIEIKITSDKNKSKNSITSVVPQTTKKGFFMKNKLTWRLLAVFSLLFLPFSQQVLAADKVEQSVQMTTQAVEKININQATGQQLTVVKGIGEKKAQAIIDYREVNGDFVELNELVNVKGIGQVTLKKIQPFFTL
jgi:competence protein ComEA